MKSIFWNLTNKYGNRLGIDLTYFIGNGFWVVLRQVIGALTGLFVSVALARLTSQETFGQYQFIFSILSVVAIFAVPGFNTVLIQSVSKGNDGDYQLIVKKSFVWSFLGVPILAILGGYYYLFIEKNIGIAFLLAAPLFPFFYSLNFWDGFLQAKKMFKLSTIFAVAQSILSSFFLVGVVYFTNVKLSQMILVYLSVYIVLNIIFLKKSYSYISNNKKDDDTISFGYFINKLSILGNISSNLDRILIGAFISMEALSIYAVGALFVTQVFELSKAILSTSLPKIAHNINVSRRNYFLIAIFSLALIPILIIGFWVILKIFYPPAFLSALPLFLSGIIFLPFFSLSTIYNFQVLFSRHKKLIAWNAISFHLLKIFLIPVFALLFGVNGLAFLLGFQYLLFLIVASILQKKINKNSVI